MDGNRETRRTRKERIMASGDDDGAKVSQHQL